MGFRKSSSRLELAKHQARAGAAGLKVQAADARERVAPVVADARDRVGPTVADARDRLAPVVADARDRARDTTRDTVVPAVTSTVHDAKDRLAPAVAAVVAESRDKLSELTETVATKLDDKLPDDRTPAIVKEHSARSGGAKSRVLGVLALFGFGALLAFVASKRAADQAPTWQAAPPRPVPTAAPDAAAPAAAQEPHEAHDTAGGTPDEAASDAVESAHEPTTPENPTEVVDLEKKD